MPERRGGGISLAQSRNRAHGDSIVRIDGGPELRRVVTCTYDVTYAEPGCPAPTQLSITREDLASCPVPSAMAATLIEAHGLASSPCASIVPMRLAATVREESCVYAVTEREYTGAPSSFSWVVLH